MALRAELSLSTSGCENNDSLIRGTRLNIIPYLTGLTHTHTFHTHTPITHAYTRIHTHTHIHTCTHMQTHTHLFEFLTVYHYCIKSIFRIFLLYYLLAI